MAEDFRVFRQSQEILRGVSRAGFLSSPQNELTTASVTTPTTAQCIIFQKSAPSSRELLQIISTQ